MSIQDEFYLYKGEKNLNGELKYKKIQLVFVTVNYHLIS